jgi:hypothetical protein
MSRLIFFSGGVESTPLLLQANPADTIVTVGPTFVNTLSSFHHDNCIQIADYFGLTVNFVQIALPVKKTNTRFVHQFSTFITLAHLWCLRDPDITQVWLGRNCTEVPKIRNPDDPRTRELMSWDTMHPDIPVLHPLEHLSKQQHWQMIPDAVKPFVTSCDFQTNCGKCNKCNEFKDAIGDHPSMLNPV